jgi:hypothetical protein
VEHIEIVSLQDRLGTKQKKQVPAKAVIKAVSSAARTERHLAQPAKLRPRDFKAIFRAALKRFGLSALFLQHLPA